MVSFIPGERAPRTHWVGGWVGPRTDLDAVANKKETGTAPACGGGGEVTCDAPA